MFVSLCQIELMLPDSNSLKDKRMALSKIKQRLRNKFNISIAEVDHNELWQRSTLGIALVANKRGFVEQQVQKILNFIDTQDYVTVLDIQNELL